MDVHGSEGDAAMRDPLVRGVSAGLILALPILIHVASATSSVASPSARPIGSVVVSLGLVEAVVAVGLWLAGKARCRLASSEPIDLGRTAFTTSLNAEALPG
jgi:hypothetical protein